MTNPFETLGLPPRMDLVRDLLERRYRELSREHHPDFQRGGDRFAVLARSAEINDAYRTLRDPWRRAEVLIQLADPDALAQTKTLCPMFLMEAMELREAVEAAAPAQAAGLEHAIRDKIDEYFAGVAARLEAGEVRAAATLLHQSNYYRKALADLRDRIDAA